MRRKVLSVGEITRYVKNLFTGDAFLSSVSVEGEVSNCKYHSSGHIYFSLKDENAFISCVMFAGDRRSGLPFRMQDGDRVVVHGRVDVYERDGRYQLYARRIERTGAGLLYARFLELKKELEEEGLFSREYKKPIPRYARTIGIVTAPAGAAIRDIEKISARRNPCVQLILRPALVQGSGAAASICAGIRELDRLGVDVIIVGRGGGSIEDLWAFNEEAVARAIFACETPVISAVGHETDTTIADFAADLRAPTPSAAAELAVFDLEDFRRDVALRREKLRKELSDRIRQTARRRDLLLVRVRAGAPAARIREARHRTDQFAQRLPDALTRSLDGARMRAETLSVRLDGEIRRAVSDRRHRQLLYIERFRGLNPLDRLRQGYSFSENESGRPVRSIGDVSEGQGLSVYVTDGVIRAEVRKTEPYS